jgi:tetratricopeptide (TPR) repeat protein
MVRRNKLVFAAASAVLAALLIGLGGSMWMFFKEKSARERAVSAENARRSERERAESKEQVAKQVGLFLRDMLEGAGPGIAQGKDTTLLRQIFDRTATRISTDLKDQPAVYAELCSTLGRVYYDIGSFDRAEAMLSEALDIRRQLFGTEHLLIADSTWLMAHVRYIQRRLPEAESLAREALLTTRIKLLGREHLSVAEALETVGAAVNEQGRLYDAECLYREALELRRKLNAMDGKDVTDTMSILAHNLGWQGNEPEAEKLLREAIALCKKRGPEDPYAILPLHYLARSLLKQDRPGEAEAASREALALAKKVFGEGHPTTYSNLCILCSALVANGRTEEAEAMILKVPESAGIRESVIRMLGWTDRLRESLQMQIQFPGDAKPEKIAEWQKKLDDLDKATAGKKADKK